MFVDDLEHPGFLRLTRHPENISHFAAGLFCSVSMNVIAFVYPEITSVVRQLWHNSLYSKTAMELTIKSYLPELKWLSKGIRKGQSLYEAPQQGWGRQFGYSRQRILSDELYQDALAVLKGCRR